MAFKTIAVFTEPSPAGEARAAAGAALALLCGAHLVGVYALPLALPESAAETFVRGEEAMRAVIAGQQAREERDIAAVRERFAAIAARQGLTPEFRVIRWMGAEDEALLQSLHSDLVIVGPPQAPGLPEKRAPDALLLASGVPMLVLPPDSALAPEGRTLVAWNASRQARRALTDALPLLRSAASVVLLVVDPERRDAHGEEAGADIGLFLARHGVTVEVQQRASEGEPVGAVILRAAQELGAGLIVLGAYSRARTAEVVFGGVTRFLLKSSSIPLLVAH